MGMRAEEAVAMQGGNTLSHTHTHTHTRMHHTRNCLNACFATLKLGLASGAIHVRAWNFKQALLRCDLGEGMPGS